MASNFNLSGPSHLTHVNWDDAYNRQSVAASLVQGVYVQEKDRQKQRNGPDSLAHHWWEFFHFKLHKPLFDDVDKSIFGAIYEFNPQSSMCKDTLHGIPPRYVIAFRGTLFKLETFLRDIELDLKILMHGLHQDSRLKIATEAVREMVDNVGGNGSNIWLAGHSLGSSIALHAGKTMAKSGTRIESFLFNPPFPSASLDRMIKSEKKKRRIRKLGRLIKTGIYIFNKSSFDESFAALSPWSPSLFVNRSDIICSKYVEYFEQRRKMKENGAGSKGQIAEAQISLSSIMMSAFGKESDPLHLIPSANLIVNFTPAAQSIAEAHRSFKEAHGIAQSIAEAHRSFKEAHGIHQWWKPDLHLDSKLHKY